MYNITLNPKYEVNCAVQSRIRSFKSDQTQDQEADDDGYLSSFKVYCIHERALKILDPCMLPFQKSFKL